MGLNNLSSIKNYFATDYMLETILLVYCLLFINTFYLYKLDASKNNNIILLNSQKNDTTISSKLMDIQSAENCKGFSETARQLSNAYKLFSFTSLIGLTYCVLHSLDSLSALRADLHFTNVAYLVSISILELTSFYSLTYSWDQAFRESDLKMNRESDPKKGSSLFWRDRAFVLSAERNAFIKQQVRVLCSPSVRNTVKYPVRAFSSMAPANKLDPAFLTGFIDAEGSFMIKIMRSSTSCLG